MPPPPPQFDPTVLAAVVTVPLPPLKTPADPKHEIDKSYTYGKLFFL